MARAAAGLAHRGLLHRVLRDHDERGPAPRGRERAARDRGAAHPQCRGPREDGRAAGHRRRPAQVPDGAVPLRAAPHGLRSDPRDPQAPPQGRDAGARHARPDHHRRGDPGPGFVGPPGQWRHGQDGALADGGDRPRAGRPCLHRHHLPAPGEGRAAPGPAGHEAGGGAALLPVQRHAGRTHRAPGRAPEGAVPDDPFRFHALLRLRARDLRAARTARGRPAARRAGRAHALRRLQVPRLCGGARAGRPPPWRCGGARPRDHDHDHDHAHGHVHAHDAVPALR